MAFSEPPKTTGARRALDGELDVIRNEVADGTVLVLQSRSCERYKLTFDFSGCVNLRVIPHTSVVATGNTVEITVEPRTTLNLVHLQVVTAGQAWDARYQMQCEKTPVLEWVERDIGNEGARYEGYLLKGERAERGWWKQGNGDVYEGHYKANQMDGLGTWIYSNGHQYFGEWKNDEMSGLGCYMFNPEGTEFSIGQYLNDKKQGEGLYQDPSGQQFIITYDQNNEVNRRPATFAEMLSYFKKRVALRESVRGVAPKTFGAQTTLKIQSLRTAAGVTYEGGMKGDKKHGFGYWTHPEGEWYEGYYEDGKQSGWGVYWWASGRHYIGYWKNGGMDGWGVYFFNAEETEYYTGTYRENKRHGTGLYQFANGSSRFQKYADGDPTPKQDDEAPPERKVEADNLVRGILETIKPLCPHYVSRFH